MKTIMKLAPVLVVRTSLSRKLRRSCTSGLNGEPNVAVAIRHCGFAVPPVIIKMMLVVWSSVPLEAWIRIRLVPIVAFGVTLITRLEVALPPDGIFSSRGLKLDRLTPVGLPEAVRDNGPA